MNVCVLVALCEVFTAVVAHSFYVYAFIACGRVAVVNPQERTDFHFFLRLLQDFVAVGGNINDFCRSEFVFVRVAEVHVGKVFKGKAVRKD